MAAADHVQPSSERPGRNGDLLAAVPRSVQLQLRSDDRHRPRHGRRARCTTASCRKGSRASRCAPARSYSTWWNGGLRTTAYFQNIIGLLTEIIGNPTPSQIPATMNTILPRADLPSPIAPQEWKFRQSIDYSVTANYAVLDLASRYKDQFLYNIYKMGSNQIERGSRDHWTISNEDMVRLRAAVAPRRQRRPPAAAGWAWRRRAAQQAAAPAATRQMRRRAAARWPRRWRHPDGAVQPGAEGSGAPRSARLHDRRPTSRTSRRRRSSSTRCATSASKCTRPPRRSPPTARTIRPDSYVVKTAQAGRAHVLDMFEPQDHPNDMDERGIPRRPYDSAGWTLVVPDGRQVRSAVRRRDGHVHRDPGAGEAGGGQHRGTAAAGYLISPSINDAFTIANRVLKANGEVYSARGADDGERPDLSRRRVLRVARARRRTPIVQAAAKELGVNVDATGVGPRGRDEARREARSRCGTRRPARCRRAGRGSCSSASSSRTPSSAAPASMTRRCGRSTT